MCLLRSGFRGSHVVAACAVSKQMRVAVIVASAAVRLSQLRRGDHFAFVARSAFAFEGSARTQRVASAEGERCLSAPQLQALTRAAQTRPSSYAEADSHEAVSTASLRALFGAFFEGVLVRFGLGFGCAVLQLRQRMSPSTAWALKQVLHILTLIRSVCAFVLKGIFGHPA
jgi:hypothetical protein